MNKKSLPSVKTDTGRIALYVLFFLSGISGLIYETVWLRMLIRLLGSTTYATSVMLAAFMAGMALGSFMIGKYAAGVKNQLRLYAILELCVGVTALSLTLSLSHLTPLYRVVYDMVLGNRFELTIFQSILMFIVLLIPTILMGGTLPVLSSHTKAHNIAFTPRIGFLYGLNTLGAVVGVVGSGIYCIGAWGEIATFSTGIVITVGVALLAYLLSRKKILEKPVEKVVKTKGKPESAQDSQIISPYSESTRRLIGITYALSGFAAMAYEIVWTRMFQIKVGTSIYAFSIMLAFYLAGVGIGSLFGGKAVSKAKNPIQIFGVAQLGIGLYGIIGMFIFTHFDPVSLNVNLDLNNALLMPLLVVFPITFVLGMMFPAVCRSYVRDETEVSRAVGRLYALNTMGCIFGSLTCGFVLLWLLGTRGSLLALAGLNLAIGLVILFRESARINKAYLWTVSGAAIVAGIVLSILSPDPFGSAVQRAIQMYFGEHAKDVQIYFQKEDIAATTTALGIPNDPMSKHLWVNGIGMTNLCTETKIMAHLPLLLHQNPKDMLIICFGMGTTVRSARIHKQIQCDVVELIPEVYKCLPYFHKDGAAILADPRIHRYVDDGRNFMLMRPKKYDVITLDPPPPIWSTGAVNLCTKEFFETCKQRLNPHGIICYWVPPVQVSEVTMIMKTFHTVFPGTYVFRSTWLFPPGFFLIGLKDPQPLNYSRFQQENNNPDIVKDLNEWTTQEFKPLNILDLFVSDPDQLTQFVKDARVITDDHPYIEFPLWRSYFDKYYKQYIQLSAPPSQGK